MQDLGYDLESLDNVVYSLTTIRLTPCETCNTKGCDAGCTNGCGTCLPGCSSGGVIQN